MLTSALRWRDAMKLGPVALLAVFAVFPGGVLVATDARAQPATGAIAGGTVGVAAIDSSTDLSVSGSAGYRFNRVFGLGIELTSVPTLSGDSNVYLPYRAEDNGGAGGRVTIFTTNVRLEIPTTTPRVVPYAVVGGGVANVKERVDVVIGVGILVPATQPAPIPLMYPPPDFRQTFLFSTTNLALTVGGGVSFLAGGHVSVDVDLRYLRLMGEADRNVGRFGGGVSYRF